LIAGTLTRKQKKAYGSSGCSELIKFTGISEKEAKREGIITETPAPDSENAALLAEIQKFFLIQAIPEISIEMVRAVRCFREEKLPARSTRYVTNLL